MYTLNVRVCPASGSDHHSPRRRRSPESRVLVRVHAYKSLAFAFSPYQAIRIFYFNLITPNRFELPPCLTSALLSLSPFLSLSFCVCFCFCLALCFGICHVAGLVFVINLNLPPHSHTSAWSPGTPGMPTLLASWCPLSMLNLLVLPTPFSHHNMIHCLPLPHCERASTNESSNLAATVTATATLSASAYICMRHIHPAIWIHFNESNTIIPGILDSSLDNYVATHCSASIQVAHEGAQDQNRKYLFVLDSDLDL